MEILVVFLEAPWQMAGCLFELAPEGWILVGTIPKQALQNFTIELLKKFPDKLLKDFLKELFNIVRTPRIVSDITPGALIARRISLRNF